VKDHKLSKDELDRVLKFEGYGSKTAPYWFLGIEEGGGSIEQLRVRARLFAPVEDLCSALSKLGLVEMMHRHVPTWRVMSKLIMAMQGTSGWEETSSAREYQATRLGRADGDTFLTELLPLPSRSTGVWPYPSIFPTRADYYEAVRPGRIGWLRSEISAHRPRFVICYGKGNWRHHQNIFSDVEFRPELNEKIRIGQREHSTILLLPFLSYDLVTTALIKQIADLLEREHREG
jgi:hypothetical protein